MVSQFVSTHAVRLLGDIDFTFPEGTHAIGRLDNESEGLLLLTTDKKVTRLIFLGEQPHKRTYLVMVQNEMSDETLQKLKTGIPIRIKGGEYHTAVPTGIEIIKDPLALYAFASDRREQYPHTWLLITLTEGKYHQVRKMVLAVRHRCLRLIRLSMEQLTIEGIAPGTVKELSEKEFYTGARISKRS
ncbi:rRNA pseudouridine synthase [Ferruginibacter sp. HRS2-29]|nr:rRNA pseudouridine synthase [Ferruginibacter sp. HRS2-29]